MSPIAALKRGDSSSKRKTSSISDASDHAGGAESAQEPTSANDDAKDDAPPETPLYDVPEESDRLEENMPWLKVVTRLVNGFNFYCTHQGFCHPNCFKRQMRASKRIMEAARRVYGEEIEYTEDLFAGEGPGGGRFGMSAAAVGGRSVDAGEAGGGGVSTASQRRQAGSRMGNSRMGPPESNGASPDHHYKKDRGGSGSVSGSGKGEQIHELERVGSGADLVSTTGLVQGGGPGVVAPQMPLMAPGLGADPGGDRRRAVPVGRHRVKEVPMKKPVGQWAAANTSSVLKYLRVSVSSSATTTHLGCMRGVTFRERETAAGEGGS